MNMFWIYVRILVSCKGREYGSLYALRFSITSITHEKTTYVPIKPMIGHNIFRL
jgi:hypothetical protein